MPIESFVTDLEEVDESLRSLYIPTEKDAPQEGYVLDVDVRTHPSAKALKSALDAERKKAKEAAQLVKKFEGVDLERWEELSAFSPEDVERWQELSTLSSEDLELFRTWHAKQRGTKNGDGGDGQDPDFESRLERVTSKMREQHAKEIELREKKLQQLEEEHEKLTQELVRDKIDSAILRLAGARGAIDPEDVLLQAQGIWRIDAEDGQPTAYDSAGDVIRGTDGIKKLTQAEWLDDLASKKPYLFKESLGGGAAGVSGRGGKTSRVKTKADLKTVSEKVAFISEHGQEAFEELPVQ